MDEIPVSKKTMLGGASILMGLLLSVYYFLGYFFVNYFTSLGWKDYGSALGLSLLLLFGGIVLFINYGLGNTAIVGFIVGNVIDRIFICSIYSGDVSLGMVLFPTMSSLIMAVVWYKNREVQDLKKPYLLMVLMLVLLIIVHPKLVE